MTPRCLPETVAWEVGEAGPDSSRFWEVVREGISGAEEVGAGAKVWRAGRPVQVGEWVGFLGGVGEEAAPETIREVT